MIRPNATLVRVREATAATGGRDDWDDALAPPAGPDDEPTGSGAVKLEGPFRVYVRETVDRAQGGDTIDRTTHRTVYFAEAELGTVELDTDDVVELELDDGTTLVDTAEAVTRSRTPGLPAAVRTGRLDLKS